MVRDNRPVNLNVAEFERNNYCLILGRDTPWLEVFNRSFWENVAYKLRPSDTVEIISHDYRVKFTLHLLDVNHRTSPPIIQMIATPIYPADLNFPTDEATDRQRFRVRAMRGSAREFEILDSAEGNVVRDHMPRDTALDVAAALELDAQDTAKMTAATAAAAALAKPERINRVERNQV